MLPDQRDATNMQAEEYDERHDIYLDARVFSDRDADRHHTGRHRDVIAKMVEHRKWGGWLRDAHRKSKEIFRNWERGPILPIVVLPLRLASFSCGVGAIERYVFAGRRVGVRTVPAYFDKHGTPRVSLQ